MIEKIISGGQTGADQGGLEAAFEYGLETGGHIPKDFKTEEGNDPSLKKYFLEETKSKKYPIRTELNVRNSDATIWFGKTDSAGYYATQKFATKHNKLFLIYGTFESNKVVSEWLLINRIKILNVAGNRESKFPGLQFFVKSAIMEILELCDGDDGWSIFNDEIKNIDPRT